MQSNIVLLGNPMQMSLSGTYAQHLSLDLDLKLMNFISGNLSLNQNSIINHQ